MFKPVGEKLSIILACLAGVAIAILVLAHYNTQMINLANALRANAAIFILWRYGLMLLLLACWPRLINWVGHYRGWNTEVTQLMVKKRLHIGLLFILIELFIIHDGLNYIFSIM